MEVIIGVVVFGIIAYWAFNALNKEKSDGSHALDVLSKPVEKAPEPVVATPVAAVVTNSNPADNVPVVVATPAKKTAKPKAAAKPKAPAKKAPAKKAPAKAKKPPVM